MSAAPAPAFLDTSYVVRYLTNDPPDMAEQAARIIDSDQPLILSELVVAETAYVLTSVYGIPRAELVDALVELIRRENLSLLKSSKPRVLEALLSCRESKRYSYTDVLLWAEAREHGAERIYSFDGKFPSQGLTIFSFDPPSS